jgi:hypothetical protein
MTEAILVALVFGLLLACEWRYQLRTLRLAIVMLALGVMFFAQPGYISVARRVSVAPPKERITEIRGKPISEYLSGVTTLYEAFGKAGRARRGVRLVALGTLVLLACSPVLRRVPRLAAQADPGTGSG